MIRACICALLLGAGALVASGCGGSERVAYERDLAEVGRLVDDALEALPRDETRTIGPEQVATLADELDEAANQLEDLDPPDDAKDAQARLERGLRGVSDAFDELAVELQEADTDQEQAEVFVTFATDQRVDEAFDDIVGAQEAYAANGYRVFRSDADDARP